jgi:hypothetical protein
MIRVKSEGEEHAENFLKALKEYSQDKNDPVSEWTLLDFTGYDDDGQCICEKEIKVIYYIQNKITTKILEIGSDCAERWLSCKLWCSNCNASLGNVMKRRREMDYLCKLCKKNKKLADTFEFRFGKKYRGKPWAEVVQDEKYIDWLANLDTKTSYIEDFLQYCSTYYYDFEVV